MYKLAREASHMLVDKWNSRLLTPDELNGCLICVQLPNALYGSCQQVTYTQAEIIQNTLYHRFNIEVPIKAIDGHLYVRISAHIYNELGEYEELADAVSKLTQEQVLKDTTD